MPIGIVSDEDFLKEEKNSGIKVPDKEEPKAEIIDITKGRGHKTEVPEAIREIVAKSAINGEGTGKEIARAFGVSESSVSAYKVGSHSTTSYDSPDPTLKSKLVNHKQAISGKARRTLMSALRNITPEKLEGVKPRDLAAIAKDMSSIVSDMEEKSPVNQNNQSVQVVFMAPRVKKIDEYRVVDLVE